jgi:hypothetical protein
MEGKKTKNNENIKDRKDAEKVVKDEITKSILSGKKIDIGDIKKSVDKRLESKKETVQKIMKDSILVRGSIIETSIHIENVLNEIFLQYYDPLDFNHFKKDFLFKTLGFSQKKDILNKIIKRENLKEKNIVSEKFVKNFGDLIEIRNIYAHYPEDVFNNSFYIETSHNQFKSMKELNQKFMDLAQSLFDELTKITNHVAKNKIKDEKKNN